MILHETSKIQVIATEKSGNRKIGKAIQIWIVPKSETVTDSRRNGNDAKTQCKGCPLASNHGCYVGSYYVDAIQKSAWAGKKPRAKNRQQIVDLVKGKFVRFGAYGNPSMIPLSLVKRLKHTLIISWYHASLQTCTKHCQKGFVHLSLVHRLAPYQTG